MIATGTSPHLSCGRANDGHLADRGEDVLDLGAVDVLAAGDDHVLPHTTSRRHCEHIVEDFLKAPRRTAQEADAGGYCLRAPAQGACPYANICEHCPSFHTDATHLGILAAQRIDAQHLAADAAERGWIDEADRHRKLIARLDTLIAQSAPA